MPVTDVSTVVDVADRLFVAIERSDVAAGQQLFDRSVTAWKSGNNREGSVRVIRWFIDSTVARRSDVLHRQVFDGGFVQRHLLHATGRAGGSMELRVCIVIKVGDDGRIISVDEYAGPAGLTPPLGEEPT